MNAVQLQKAFALAYKAAKGANDDAACQVFIDAKDQRKEEIAA